MPGFSIREDLEFRPFDERVEIMWISGPSARDTARIAAFLQVSVADINAALVRLARKPGKRYDYFRDI